MIVKISFLILCFQAINWAVCWDPKSPLILNKTGNEIFFPRYVDKLNVNGKSSITYVRPGDDNTSTYTFCYDFSSRSGLPGILLSENPERTCTTPVDFTREPLKDSNGKVIPCGGEKEENAEYRKYKTYFKLLINNESFTQSSYDYCYDDKNNLSMLYAHYDIDNPSLLNNELLAEEQNYEFVMKKVTLEDPYMDTDISPFYNKQTVYKPHEVAISDFIPFGHRRKSFYQPHNVAPMEKNLHKPWNIFKRNIRGKLAQKTDPIKVYSGIHGLRRIEDLSTRYLPSSKITIPLVWWVILYNEDTTRGISLIMHNYAYDDLEQRPQPLCGKSVCGLAGLEDVIPRDRYSRQAMIYCCPASTIAEIVSMPEDILTSSEKLLQFNE